MREKFSQLKKIVIEAVLWAEKELKGKSGAEKKKAVKDRVTKMLLSMVKVPWYLGWTKGVVAPLAVNYMIDLACEKLNFLTDWNFGDTELNEVQIAELASVLDAPMSAMVNVYSAEDITSTDNRLEKLYSDYAINPIGTPEEGTRPATGHTDNRLSNNLTRKEVACKCGCGFDIVDPKLVDTFQTLRDYINKPINITSGCRCPEHNKNQGGVANSAHMEGQALDMTVDGLSNRQFGEIVKKCYREGKLPHLRYCYLIAGKTNTAIHIGTDEKARKGLWGW